MDEHRKEFEHIDIMFHVHDHTCFHCTKAFNIDKATKCPVCGWMKCGHCGKCYCDLTKEAQNAVHAIETTYCRFCNPCKRKKR